MNEKCNLDIFEKDTRAATVYIAFFDPKIQQDAIELIYHNRNPGKNIQWIIEKRKFLEENGYLIRENNNLRGAVFRANVDPIINTILEEIERRGSFIEKNNLTTIESIKTLKIILDSFWFRNFYSKKVLKNPFSYKNNELISTYQYLNNYTKGEPLEIINIKHLLLNLINEVGHCSYTFNKLIALYPDLFPTNEFFHPDINELNSIGNFEEYITKKIYFLDTDFIKYFYSVLNSDRNIMTDAVNEKETFFLMMKLSHKFKVKRDRSIRQFILKRDDAICQCPKMFNPECTYSRKEKILTPAFKEDKKFTMPQSFIDCIYLQSALTPLTVSNIMRKGYHNTSLALEERCETVTVQFQKFFEKYSNFELGY
jgi:hypothetical protein